MQTWGKRLLLFFGLLIVILIVYHPVLTTTYLYHDDVNFFLQTPTQKVPKSFHLSLSIGRFIGAPIYAGYSWIVNSIDDLKRIRFLSLLQFAWIAYLIQFLLRPLFRHFVLRLTVALMIVCLPSFQVLATQAGYAFQTTGVLLSLLAVYMINRISTEKGWLQSIFSLYGCLGCGLFILGIATHPSTSMFYWTGMGIVLLGDLRSGSQTWIKRAGILLTLGCSAMVLYALGLKISRMISPPGDYGIYNPHSIATDIGGKFHWFVTEPFVNASNFYTIFPSVNTTLIISLGILLCGLFGAMRMMQRLNRRQMNRPLLQTAAALVLCVLLIILSFSTNLLAVGNAAFYRCLIALSALLLIYLISGIHVILNTLPLPKRQTIIFVLSLLLLALTGYWTHDNIVRFRTWPSQVETQHLLSRMRDEPIIRFGRIHLIHPDRKELLNRYDEFGGPTSSFRGDTIGLISAGVIETLSEEMSIYQIHYDFKTNVASYIFEDDSKSKKAFRLQISSGTKTDAIYGSIPTLIIDMTSIYQSEDKLSYLRK